MYNRWSSEVNFITIYINEAHPIDEWHMYVDICFKQPKTLEDRSQIAHKYIEEEKFPIPLYLDLLTDECEAKYFAWPERLYVIQNQKIVFQGAKGPDGYKPELVDLWLESHRSQF